MFAARDCFEPSSARGQAESFSYLEALDRQHYKPQENPMLGLRVRASQDEQRTGNGAFPEAYFFASAMSESGKTMAAT